VKLFAYEQQRNMVTVTDLNHPSKEILGLSNHHEVVVLNTPTDRFSVHILTKFSNALFGIIGPNELIE
jgi:hypothetical protein